MCVQQSWTILTGESPVKVIAKKPCSQPLSVVEILGLKKLSS
ncbi:hypothetical protein [Clostridium tetanomorphum]|nr:hypothetical protein [Clostridium tetanomorphum]MBP1865770.1 hypothetical protein [Clostridium tetanomorphum]